MCTLENNAKCLAQLNALLHTILPWRTSTRHLKEMLLVSFNTKGRATFPVWHSKPSNGWVTTRLLPHAAERIESSGDSSWVDTQYHFTSQLTNPQGERAAVELRSGVIWCSQSYQLLQVLPSAPRDLVCPVVCTLKIRCQAPQISSKSLNFTVYENTCGQEQ